MTNPSKDPRLADFVRKECPDCNGNGWVYSNLRSGAKASCGTCHELGFIVEVEE